MASIIIPAVMTGVSMYLQHKQQKGALDSQQREREEMNRRQYALAAARWKIKVAQIKQKLANNPELRAKASPEYLAQLDRVVPPYRPGAWTNPMGNSLLAAGAGAASTAGSRWPNPPSVPPPYEPPDSPGPGPDQESSLGVDVPEVDTPDPGDAGDNPGYFDDDNPYGKV